MSVHTGTGNGLDVVHDYEDGRMNIRGIKARGGELIPLRDPQALADVLSSVIKEAEDWNTKQKYANSNSTNRTGK